MHNLIIIKLNGIYHEDNVKKYRKEIVKEIKEGVLILDEKVKEINAYTIPELGVEFIPLKQDEK